MQHGLPPAAPGMTIGLLGGSFDPPHAGHEHISRMALTRLGLDKVWWLVSPGNPLKTRQPATVDRRLNACRALLRHPRILATDLEVRLGTRYTAETLSQVKLRYSGVRFVWIMGADNLAGFHRWDRWTHIFQQVPIAVAARPGEQLSAGMSVAAKRFARFRLPSRRAKSLPGSSPPCWTFLTGPMLDISSTRLREGGHWP